MEPVKRGLRGKLPRNVTPVLMLPTKWGRTLAGMPPVKAWTLNG